MNYPPTIIYCKEFSVLKFGLFKFLLSLKMSKAQIHLKLKNIRIILSKDFKSYLFF